MSMVYPVMKHYDTMICFYKFSLIILEREFSVQINDDVKDFSAPQIPLTVSNVDDTVIVNSEFK